MLEGSLFEDEGGFNGNGNEDVVGFERDADAGQNADEYFDPGADICCPGSTASGRTAMTRDLGIQGGGEDVRKAEDGE